MKMLGNDAAMDALSAVLMSDESKTVGDEADHVIAKSTGGSDRHWNRVTACSDCNASKDEATLGKWLVGCAPTKVKHRKRKIAAYTEIVASGRVKLSAMAATTVIGPCLVKKLRSEGLMVEENSGAETAAWQRIAKVEKSHAMDAACTAAKGQPFALRCERPMNIKMTGRGRRLVVIRNKQGFHKLLKNGGQYEHHRENPPHGFRTGDCVRIDKHGFGTRWHVGLLKTGRWDGRYEVEFRNGTKRNVMASKLELIHHGCGAQVR